MHEMVRRLAVNCACLQLSQLYRYTSCKGIYKSGLSPGTAERFRRRGFSSFPDLHPCEPACLAVHASTQAASGGDANCSSMKMQSPPSTAHALPSSLSSHLVTVPVMADVPSSQPLHADGLLSPSLHNTLHSMLHRSSALISSCTSSLASSRAKEYASLPSFCVIVVDAPHDSRVATIFMPSLASLDVCCETDGGSQHNRRCTER
jgi:hypothetical protein